MFFYLDESGDEGFHFDRPYRQGGSSRYLTIAAVEVPNAKAVFLSNLIDQMQQTYGWTSKEKKGAHLSKNQRSDFVGRVKKLVTEHPDIRLHVITVFKPNVQVHIRSDSNKLYNYMVRLLLLERMALHPQATLAHDQRSIQVASGNSLKDYLQTELWFTKKAQTALITRSLESHANKNILFVDYLAHISWASYEDDATEFGPLKGMDQCQCAQLYFPRS